MSSIFRKKQKKPTAYVAFDKIDGGHPLKQAVDNIYVGYSAYVRAGGEVGYFNFELAKEMGLIPQKHPHILNAELKKKLLNTFSLQIINEYDVAHKTKIDQLSIKGKDYMATRYLQIQHPNKQGKTSGDGRSIWNGHFKSRTGEKVHWDISSCGTGATRLSPATANENQFFKTGTRLASYGCGRATFSEGMIAALFSNMMYQKGISTERTLAVIRYKNGNSVNVRVSKNLLRPAHFFGYMKRGELTPLKQLMDYYIGREIENKNLKLEKTKKARYQFFLHALTRKFATAAAIFESEYIFCWMDWDGDNILMDGGIIDYGTIRQFGLFHHEYRYDDVDKMSTNITEQKNRAKYTVQRFCQVVDFLLTGEKKNIKLFAQDSALAHFDECFQKTLVQQLLVKVGFTSEQQQALLKNNESRKLAFDFQQQYRFFEKAVSGRRAYKTPDGVTRDAIFCMRDFLREFPINYKKEKEIMPPLEFIATVASNYSSLRDLNKYERKTIRIGSLQRTYLKLVEHSSVLSGVIESEIINQLIKRSSIINRHDILTGNGVIKVIDNVLRKRSKLSFSEFQSVIHQIAEGHITDPDFISSLSSSLYRKTKMTKEIATKAGKIVGLYRESI